MTNPTGLARDLDFSGRRVLITGAANGFGAALAHRFAEHHATLVLARQPTRSIKPTPNR
jgi:NAD(P)-dependent dehydrogenase (short-subunit alcohol dehydrogenase family)